MTYDGMLMTSDDMRMPRQCAQVYLLECQPVCSFARESAMIGMALKTDVPELQACHAASAV